MTERAGYFVKIAWCTLFILVVALYGVPRDGLAGQLGKVDMYMSQGEHERALALLASMIKDNPESVDAYNSRAFVYLKLNRPNDALADFSRIIGIQPGGAAAYMSRGLVYDRLGDRERSLDDYRKACELGDSAGCSFVEQIKGR